MNIYIINGPNLNLIGTREPAIYGSVTFVEHLQLLKSQFPLVNFTYFQSNIEGELIDKIQEAGEKGQGLIVNPAGYSHTSVAIADAIGSIHIPTVEVHISNIYSREDYRHRSFSAARCKGVVSGFGLKSYTMALLFLLDKIHP